MLNNPPKSVAFNADAGDCAPAGAVTWLAPSGALIGTVLVEPDACATGAVVGGGVGAVTGADGATGVLVKGC